MAEYGIQALNCACRVAAERTGNQRYAVKELIAELKQKFPHVDQMIMRAARNVNLDCVLGWQQGGRKYSYLDFYDQ